MHTFKRGGVRIHHNGDFSGDAIVSADASPQNIEITLPCSVLLAFAAHAVRCKKIEVLENASDAQLLGIELPDGGADAPEEGR